MNIKGGAGGKENKAPLTFDVSADEFCNAPAPSPPGISSKKGKHVGSLQYSWDDETLVRDSNTREIKYKLSLTRQEVT